MARIESLSILASSGGNDYLAEKYGETIENIQSKNVSAQIKNTDLSGNPESGTVEAKRFANATVNAYGTARAGGAGTKIKAKPVIVAIDKDREIIEEVEEKDVSLYGVEAVVEKRIKNHEMRMGKDMERDFFDVMSGTGDVYTTTETDIKAKVEAAIVALEKTKNEWVDGVDRMFMTVIANADTYSALQGEIDKLPNAATDSAAAEIEVYHGTKIRKSTDLPDGVEFIVQVDGSVAQPVRYTLSPAAKIPMSNAYSFGIFYSFGTKEVSPDLVKVKTDGTLTVTSAAGDASGKTAISIKEGKIAKTAYYYKTASSVTTPTIGSTLNGYTAWNGSDEITATTNHKIAIAEVNPDGKVIKAGVATVTSKA